MTAIDRADVSRRRARAGRIRQGIQSYIHTLGDVAAAYAERDWEFLGYKAWDEYVDGEFGASRLQLSPEHRQKAVQELRLAGLSQRAIGSALGVSKTTVANDISEVVNSDHLDEPPAQVKGIDGKTYQTPARRDPEPAHFPGPAVATPDEPGQPEEVAAVGEDVAVTSSAPLREFVEEDPRVQAADYLVAFTSALSRAGGFMQFDAERIGQLVGGTTWDAIEAHASVVAHWYETARKSRSGLRVIKGGAA